jgi:hypothetical protein
MVHLAIQATAYPQRVSASPHEAHYPQTCAPSLSASTFLQAKEEYVQHLEQQIGTLKALSGQLDASTRKQRSRQPLYINLQVCTQP